MAEKKSNNIGFFASVENQALIEKLDALATSLNTSRASLFWYAIEKVLAAPPQASDIKVRARVSGGSSSACGFWIIRERNLEGKVIAIKVVETLSRNSIKGQIFERYTKGDAAKRKAALTRAKYAADFDAKDFGLPKFAIQELTGADLQAATTPVVKAEGETPKPATAGVNTPAAPKKK
jgi:hypothetical protein